MTNPTSNFGWVMPTTTDLVTDLPADFEVFGQAVDTSMAGLKGGTTGQILSKTSATNMAFTWITPNPGDITAVNAGTGISGGGTSGDVTVTNSMATALTTKGDLTPATGSAAFARLGVGANDTVLTADSTAATGLKWATPAAGGMTLLSTTTLSGSSTTISSISGSYKSLYAYIYGVTITTLGADIWINPNNTNNITTQGGIQNSDGTGSIAQPAAASTLRLNSGQPILNTGGANAWDLTINNYASTTTNKSHNVNGGYKISGGSSCSYMVAGYINTTSAITSLVFTLGTGTYNGGTVLLYGVN